MESRKRSGRPLELQSSDEVDEDNDTDSDSSKRKRYESSSKKKKHYNQKFQNEWVKQFSFVNKSKKGEYHFYCVPCGSDLSCKDGRRSILVHENTSTHKRNVSSVSKQNVSVFDSFRTQKSLQEAAKINEIRVALFIVEHNIPISVADHLIPLIKSCNKNDEILQKMSEGRSKCTAIVQNVIGKEGKKQIIECLKNEKFSIIVDESNDRTSVKHMAVVARFHHQGQVKDAFLALLVPKQYDAAGLYTCLKNFFDQNEIPYKENMIGLATDGANVMMGDNHSFKTLFLKDIPHLFTLKCTSHSLALCASKAASVLPESVEKFIKSVYVYLKYSSKRTAKFLMIQELLELPAHKILNTCDVRWLSLMQCVTRFIEQYEALYAFFGEECKDKRNNEAESIFKNFQNPYNRLYLLFLKYALPLVTTENLLFQEESPKIHILFQRMEFLYRRILKHYIKDCFVDGTLAEELTYNNNENFVELSDMDVGTELTLELQKQFVTPDIKKRVLTHCRDFYIRLAHEIYSRFPFSASHISTLRDFRFINPVHLTNIKNIVRILNLFGFNNETICTVNEEYKRFRYAHMYDPLIHDMTKFWTKIENLKDGNGVLLYPNILSIKNMIEILPHSSAACEVLFSVINNNKRSDRINLEEETLTAILYV